ncbi:MULTISPECIES: hypothetical protein [Aeromonas]|uniref:hypothetical protein n=1 Tax=Aeromonas TaxID=642 RepID=UPI000B0FB161|nr:hypothetical protein [Aeromonas veronii]
MLLKFFLRCLYVAIFIFCLSANAATVDVTAEYKPAVYEDARGTFKSTTVCKNQLPGVSIDECYGNIVSLDSLLFSFKTTIKRVVVKDYKDQRDSFAFLSASGKKTMIIKSEKSKEFTVDVIPEQLGVDLESLVEPTEGWDLYQKEITNPAGGCRYVNKTIAGGTYLSRWVFLWGNIAGKSCYTTKSVKPVNDKYTINMVMFGFKIKPPSPLEMPNGTYRGSLTLSMGNNGDISFGNGEYSDNQLVINLTLTVRHQLKVLFPLKERQLDLQPPGGWTNWIHRNDRSTPASLTATLATRIWASAPYNVRLKCQYINSSGDRCLIKNERANHSVPVDVYATGMRNIQYLIYPHKDENYYGHSILSGDDRPFKFEIKNAQISEMMKHPGGRYKGDITIIIEAAI